ncbi:MAG: hypothetical protein H6599_03260 [Flavobacteriales bacterium]|nr:hypothetical protein [Flavobacteriales bacterium]
MKLNRVLSSIIMMLFFIGNYSAQECGNFIPMKEGYKWEVTNFNKKGKEEGKSVNTVSSVVNENGLTTAKVDIVSTDGKDEITTSFDISCDGTTFKMGMTFFLPAEQMEQMQSVESMEVELDMEDMEFPNELEVGQDLKDAQMTMTAKMNGIQVMNTTTIIKNRKVLGKESITTASGTYDCFKIEQTSYVKMGFIEREVKSISFLSEGIGVVRSESYDKKGELDSYSEITKVF